MFIKDNRDKVQIIWDLIFLILATIIVFGLLYLFKDEIATEAWGAEMPKPSQPQIQNKDKSKEKKSVENEKPIFNGTTYPIAEPDLLQEILAKKKMFLKKMKAYRKEILKKYNAQKGIVLSPAKRNKVYYVVPRHCTSADIYGVENHRIVVLYPKGYCFNPIDYMSIAPPPMLVANLCDKKQLKFVEDYTKKHINTMVVDSGCPVGKVSKMNLQFFAYLLLPDVEKVIKVKHTPSIVSVDLKKKAIKVQQFCLEHCQR